LAFFCLESFGGNAGGLHENCSGGTERGLR
jgi:hypothetical protein